MTTETTLTYDELCEQAPDGWHIDRHQSHADTGTILVSGPKGSILDGLVLVPDKQLHITEHDGVIEAYNVGPAGATPQTTKPPAPDDAAPVGTTPAPQAPSEHPTPEPQRDSTEGETDGHDASHKDPDKVPSSAEPEPRDEDAFPKETGGGWFELSNGKKIQGEDAALEAQVKLNNE